MKIRIYSTSLALSVLVSINDANILDLIQKNNTELRELENRYTQAELNYEKTDVIYAPMFGVDLSAGKDNTNNPGSADKLDSSRKKYTATLGKYFSTGTLFNIEATQIDYRTGLMPSIASANYNQNYIAFSLQQSLFPNFFGSVDRANIDSYYARMRRDQFQTQTDIIALLKKKLANYWKAKVLKLQVEKNKDLISQYELLNKKTMQKSKNGLASPGEYEQTLAEIIQRKQDLTDNMANLLTAVQQVREDLALGTDSDLVIDTEVKPVPPLTLIPVKLENTPRYQLQVYKTEAAKSSLDAAVKNNWPELSIYGQYAQQGLESSERESMEQFYRGDRDRYVVGIKLNYTFRSDVNTLNYKIQKQQYEIENNRSLRLKNDITNYFKDLSSQLQAAYANIATISQILKLRTEISKKLLSSYNQGRTDISILIDAYSKASQANVDFLNAYSEYSQLLYEYNSQSQTQ